MRNILGWIIAIASLILALFFGSIWFNRFRLDYNSQGKYFDELAGVVYNKDGVLLYGTLTLFFILIGLISWMIIVRTKHT
tara:strand:+ start:127 stop:366 length:240 start_codon:yes stop_codon:yes gene_type:complete